VRWLHDVRSQTHAFYASDVSAQADPITSLCRREFNPVFLLSEPLAPFCDGCVDQLGEGPDETWR
jgi:hypothetical protein